MQRLLTVSIPLALALLLAEVPLAHACKCMVAEVEDARAEASAIFEGRVLAVAEQGGEATMPVSRVTLALVRTWKGLDDKEQIDIVTNKDSAACGYEFAKDTSYLVYAQEREGQLHVSLCSRTKPMAEASEDLAVLGAGATPVDVEPKQGPTPTTPNAGPPGAPKPDAPKPGKKKGCSVALASPDGTLAEAIGFAGLALYFWRRRRSATITR